MISLTKSFLTRLLLINRERSKPSKKETVQSERSESKAMGLESTWSERMRL